PPTRYVVCSKICFPAIRFAHAAPELSHDCCDKDKATNPAHSSPKIDSPAIRPDEVNTPAFSTRALCASLKPRRVATQSPSDRNSPPMKMANVVSKGKYIPTATSMGLRTCIMIIAMPKKMPTPTSGHGILPP